MVDKQHSPRNDGDKEGKSSRRQKSTRLAQLMPKTASYALRKQGFAQTTILQNWSKIIGPDLAAHTQPMKLSFKRGQKESGVLHLLVEGSFALHVQHVLPLVIETINTFHGYKVVERITFTQGPVKKRRQSLQKSVPDLNAEEQIKLDNLLANTQTDTLKAALDKLGRQILGNKQNV